MYEFRRKAWQAYLNDKSSQNLDNLLLAYRSMVAYIANQRWGEYSHLDIDDIISEGMIGAYQAIENLDLDKVKSVDAWISLCARRKMINFSLLMQNRSTESLDSWYGESVDKTDVFFIDTIKVLPELEKKILGLRFLCDWQQKEIAELLNCTKENVWYHEKKALNNLTDRYSSG